MKCGVCGFDSKKVFDSVILGKYNAGYFLCSKCGFLQIENPTWLKEAYVKSITDSDTGIVSRCTYFTKVTSALIFFFFKKDAKFLDYGGGYGTFTRMMRDIGFDFYTVDPYTENLLARGFDYNKEKNENINLITCFECFEHFQEPIKEIDKMLKISRNIFFSTWLLPSPVPEPKNWWYYALEHGQHISFYSKKTFEYIARKYSLNFYSFGNRHLLTEKKLNPLLVFFVVKFNMLLFPIIRNSVLSKTSSDMMVKK